jgi:hypothetical protein
MRRARAIGAMTLATLLSVLTASTIGAEPGKGGVTQASKSAEPRSERGRANSNAQWSADPERGWVRAGERHRQNSPSDLPKKRSQSRQKGKGKTNKL